MTHPSPTPFRLVALSPEDDHPHELATLPALFAAGLTRYHLRKPGWTRARLAAHLDAIPAECHPHLVLHTHHDLAADYAIGGLHDRQSGAGVPPAIRRPEDRSQRPDNRQAKPVFYPLVSGLCSAGVPPASGWHGLPAHDVPRASSPCDDAPRRSSTPPARLLRSRPVHTLAELRAALTPYPPAYDTLFLSPIFPSLSKPGHTPSPTTLPHAGLSALLQSRPRPRHPEVLALGGITPDRLATVAALGFDGAAILGALWQSPDPLATWNAFRSEISNLQSRIIPPPFSPSPPLPPPFLIAITHDHHPLGDHPAQARALCAAGARHIQLRTKDAPPDRWLALAREVTAICHAHDALCIINDNPEIARDSGADGVHLGTQDAPWSDARRLLGPRTLIGGTVNNADHARAAATAHAAGDLDYIGIGPLRHTTTKQKLAPVLGLEGIRDLLARLPPALPSFVIGGVLPADLPAIRALNAAGAAVSGALLNAPDLPARHHEFLTAWSSRP